MSLGAANHLRRPWTGGGTSTDRDTRPAPGGGLARGSRWSSRVLVLTGNRWARDRLVLTGSRWARDRPVLTGNASSSRDLHARFADPSPECRNMGLLGPPTANGQGMAT